MKEKIEKLKEERKYFKKSGDNLSEVVANGKIKALYLMLGKIEEDEEEK